MRESLANFWCRLGTLLALLGATLLLGCGGSSSSNFSNAPTGLEAGNATDLKVVLAAVPAGGGASGGGGNTVRLHYNRPDGNYAGWTLYTYGGADLGGWPGKGPDGEVAGAGKYWDVTVTGAAFNFIIVKDGGGTREPSGWTGKTGSDEQQFWSMTGGKTIFKVAGDSTNYPTNPAGAAAPNINTVRVHYKRTDGQYNNWGVHIWGSSGLDVAGLKPGIAATIDQWTNAVPFTDFNNHGTDANGIVFDIPVVNPLSLIHI